MSSPVYRLTAIILKRKNTGESDRVITVFSKEKGKVRLLAKGVRSIRSRRASYLEPLGRSILMVRSYPGIDSISQAESYGKNLSTQESMHTIGAKYYIGEILEGLIPDNEPHPSIFDETVSLLGSLEGSSREVSHELLCRYTESLLGQLGFTSSNIHFSKVEQAAVKVEQVLEKRLKVRKYLALTG